MPCSHKNSSAARNIIQAVRIATSKGGSFGTVVVSRFSLISDTGEETFSITPVDSEKFKGCFLIFTFRNDGKIQMQILQTQIVEKRSQPIDLSNVISDPNACAQDIYLKMCMETNFNNSCQHNITRKETKMANHPLSASVQFFTANLPVYAKIMEAARSALHKRGTLDKVNSPGIVFHDDGVTSTEIIPVCPEGYFSDYSFVFRVSESTGSSMQIRDRQKDVRQPVDIHPWIADTAKLEQIIGETIDKEIGDKLLEKEKEPIFLDLYPNIVVQIYNIIDAARKVFLSFGAEDVKIIPARVRPTSDAEGISFYVEPVVAPVDYSEYALSFSIDRDGTSMKIIREGNDYGIPKCIGNALSSAKEISSFIRSEIYTQVLNRNDELIHSR